MVVALGRLAVVADWDHNFDRGLLYRIGWPNTFDSTRSRRNIAVVADYAAVDSALPLLEALQKDVDFHVFADHPSMKK